MDFEALLPLLNRLLPMISGPEELDRVLPLLAERGGEFCGSLRIDPEMVALTCRRGFLPMSEDSTGLDLLLVKSHVRRCVLDPADLHVSRSTRRSAAGLTLTIDSEFDRCLDAIVAYHEERWLTDRLNDSLRALHAKPLHGVRTHSVELRMGGEMIAGEIGYSCGATYTSMAGYRTGSGSGKAQLVALGALLRRAGYAMWDLGMPIPYKISLGAEVVSRTDFLDRYARASAGEARLAGSFSCAALLHGTLASHEE